MGSVLVGSHMESVLAGESFTISRNWPALFRLARPQESERQPTEKCYDSDLEDPG